ncbi:DUF4185 domain-containing protein [Microbacterium sp. ASV49]|uniref:DUF4185 domain-containing protein n=1 Tax=Microbacterium candidum TaxID=3041922 RepID=A0ABT7MTG6_9MICO|nr:DUF4185 domain-containing protein [Microbacterium sp. ASV49]MDL9977739.1 DUF4185 domain-containing protein [Microbacterium sp. ASV49]
MRGRGAIVGVIAASAAVLAGCSAGGSSSAPGGIFPSALPGAAFSARVADANTAVGVSDGDLWPSCWADDDALYAANGDGSGFGSTRSDIVVNRITGSPASGDLNGTGLASGDAVGQVWSGSDFTRKPTGMLCVHGALYLAVQDLRKDFNEAPAATIAKSTDHGRTWTWDHAKPMFADHVFTTIWFADFGKDAAAAPDPEYAYAYGLDGNWRDSFDDSVPDPTELFLARVPVASVQDRSTWEFYAGPSTGSGTGAGSGTAKDAKPTWTHDIAAKKPILVDARRVHPSDGASATPGQTVGAHDLSVLSQGGVTYLPKLGRYVYTSWTELTYEFYEAKHPWGPFTRFLSEDSGRTPGPTRVTADTARRSPRSSCPTTT